LVFRVIAGEVGGGLFLTTLAPELALLCLFFCPLRGLAAGFLEEVSCCWFLFFPPMVDSGIS
jgi:hypothetical protein